MAATAASAPASTAPDHAATRCVGGSRSLSRSPSLGTWYRDKCPGSRFLYCSRCYWGAQEASEPVAHRSAARSLSTDLVRGGFQPRLPTSLPPPGQQQQPSPLPRRQPVPLMPPAQLHPGAPQVVAPAPAVPLQSPPPSELMDVDPSAGPPSQAVAVQPVLQPLSLGTPKESETAAPCPAPTQQPSTQRQETLPLFVGPDAPSNPVPEAASECAHCGMGPPRTGGFRRSGLAVRSRKDAR
ncbi:vegetative cell wall protein gp1-like [Schistocerca americana]|uniref:vegetative cell wall protein gp1-like n=1 Tax=Schistocerca americana TaxID=7009 RepID=UPI001F4F2078|nr:vegetative cell wall protein gp1-like [Schistocerca americana]